MKVYLAARWEQGPVMRMWRTLLAAQDVACTSHWLDVQASWLRAVEGDDIMRENALLDFDDIAACDVLICYSPRSGFGQGRGGRHSELGVALGMGKPVVLVGERENIFHWHPSVVAMPDGNFNELLKVLQSCHGTIGESSPMTRIDGTDISQ